MCQFRAASVDAWHGKKTVKFHAKCLDILTYNLICNAMEIHCNYQHFEANVFLDDFAIKSNIKQSVWTFKAIFESD